MAVLSFSTSLLQRLWPTRRYYIYVCYLALTVINQILISAVINLKWQIHIFPIFSLVFLVMLMVLINAKVIHLTYITLPNSWSTIPCRTSR